MKFVKYISIFLLIMVTGGISFLLWQYSPKTKAISNHLHSINAQNPFKNFKPAQNTPKKLQKIRKLEKTPENVIENDIATNKPNLPKEDSPQINPPKNNPSTSSSTNDRAQKQEESLLSLLNQQSNSTTTQTSEPDDIESLFNSAKSPAIGSSSDINAGDPDVRKYGNTLAQLYINFDNANGDQVSAFDAFFKAPNKFNAENMEKLATNYVKLASDISNIQSPKKIESINNILAKYTKELGLAIKKLSTQKTNIAIYNSAIEYNKISERLNRQLLQIIDTFSFAGVKFSNSEPGHIFMFK